IVKREDEVTAFDARNLGALTPGYASLEMFQGKAPDPRDDVYALACVSYELLTGKHPYAMVPANKALKLGLQPKPVDGLSRGCWKGLQRGLSLRQTDRTPSAELFLAELQGRSTAYSWRMILVLLLSAATLATAVYFQPELFQQAKIALSVSHSNPSPGKIKTPPAVSPPQMINAGPKPESSDSKRSTDTASAGNTSIVKSALQESRSNAGSGVRLSPGKDNDPKNIPTRKNRKQAKELATARRVQPPNLSKGNTRVSDTKISQPTTVASRSPSTPVKMARCQTLLHKVRLGDQDSRESYLRDCAN
ncbi:MAG: hypothetical protein ACRERU_01765, partial [Methylococcales bacterium]